MTATSAEKARFVVAFHANFLRLRSLLVGIQSTAQNLAVSLLAPKFRFLDALLVLRR